MMAFISLIDVPSLSLSLSLSLYVSVAAFISLRPYKITTSPITKGSFEKSSVVQTESGSRYFLG